MALVAACLIAVLLASHGGGHSVGAEGGPEEHARHAVAAGSRTLTQIPTPEIFPAPGQQLGPSNIRTLPPDYSPGFETPRAGLPRLYKRVQHTAADVSIGVKAASAAMYAALMASVTAAAIGTSMGAGLAAARVVELVAQGDHPGSAAAAADAASNAQAAVASGTALTVGSGTPVASSQAAIGASLASVAASIAVLYADLPGGVAAALVAKAVAIPARRSAENSAKYGSAVTDMANMTYRAAWQAGLHAETGDKEAASSSAGQALFEAISAVQLAASDAQSGVTGSSQAVSGLLTMVQNTLSLAADAAGLPALTAKRVAPAPTPRPRATGKAKPKTKKPRRHLMTAAADGRSSNTLASAYIAELRAQYPTLPWGKLCTGTNKQMSLCYARQTCHAAKKAAAAGIGMYAAFLEAGAATGGATACSATIANANFIVDHIKHNKPASG